MGKINLIQVLYEQWVTLQSPGDFDDYKMALERLYHDRFEHVNEPLAYPCQVSSKPAANDNPYGLDRMMHTFRNLPEPGSPIEP
jgi:hypothetical protein